RKKKDAELKLKAGVLTFKLFIGDEGRREEEIKGPAYPKGAAPEVENHKRAQQTAEKELQEVDEPTVELRGPAFPFGPEIRLTGHPEDAEGDDEEMNHYPQILPEHVNALQGDSVEGEAADKRNRGERDVGPCIAGGPVARVVQQWHVKRCRGTRGRKGIEVLCWLQSHPAVLGVSV